MNPSDLNPNLIETTAASGGRGWLNADACSEVERARLPKFAIRPPEGLTLCKFGSRSVVGIMSSEGEPMVLKYYYPKTPLKHLTYGLLGSRARRSWETGCAWVRLGIPTAEPLALFEWKTVGGLWLSRSFLAARHVSGVSLATFVLTADANQLAAVAGALRTAFTRMEQHRAAHGDLKATNIIVGENHGVTFIDLDAAEAQVTAARWVTLRKRDEHVFFQNWKLGSAAHTAFQSVFAK